jgi:bifunctional non-homologous end joining protein LigD
VALAPMKATSGPLPTGPDWAYELKWDGMRVITEVTAGGVRAWSSNGREATATFPELAALGPALAPVECTLDGEVVAIGPDGRPNFGRLQHRMHVATVAEARRRAADVPVELIVFDLLRLGGQDTTALPWRDRRRLLEQLADDLPPATSLSTVFDDGESLFAASRQQNLEGVVAKRRGSPYVPGARTKSWVKVKVRRRQEFVVGGWASGEGRRANGLGSVLVGYHDAPGMPELRYAGRAGSGFTDAELDRLAAELVPLALDACPFTPTPPALHSRGARWVEPRVVVEIEFGEWTSDGRLRHPVYLGERIDVDPAAVVREP